MSKNKLPFGMLFEEVAPQLIEQTHIVEYSPKENISFIIDKSGNSIPFIEADITQLSTQTATKVRAESTDQDSVNYNATQTITRVKAESTDKD